MSTTSSSDRPGGASAGTRGSAAARSTTRERILFEAAELFARQGYHATTTRQIADAVGIRQPSLFHHFVSKAAIAEAMLAWDLDRALPRVRAIAAGPDPAAVRLYRYLRSDVTHLATAPYNLGGLYGGEVIEQPEFSEWARRREELHALVERILISGVASSEFIRVDPGLVRTAIDGVLVRVIAVHSGGRGRVDRLADEVADLLVRGLLGDPTQLDEVRRAADAAERRPTPEGDDIEARPRRRSGDGD